MFLLRLLAFFYLVYCAAYFARSLLAAMGQQKGPRPQNPFEAQGRSAPPPFDDFGPYGPFGPFGPFARQQQQHQQRQQQQQQQRHYQRPAAGPQAPSAYEILGVRPGASADEVRRAYQTKVREYHPDRTGSLPPELKELAEKRTKEITNAYNQLKRSR